MPGQTASEPSGIFIADDHAAVTEGIIHVLDREQDFTVVGTAADGVQAVEGIKARHPDIAIMDISMPRLNGVDAVAEVRQYAPRTRIVIYSMFAEKEYVISLFRWEVSGYVLKDEPIDDLVLALQSIRAGGTYYSSAIKNVIHSHMEELELGGARSAREVQDGIASLSSREKEIFPLLADGMSIKEIAHRLCISPKTVETHKYNIMEKLHTGSVADLTKTALRKNLIKI